MLLSGVRTGKRPSQSSWSLKDFGLDPGDIVVSISGLDGKSIEFHLGNSTDDRSENYIRLADSEVVHTVPSVWANVVIDLAMDILYGERILPTPTPSPTCAPTFTPGCKLEASPGTEVDRSSLVALYHATGGSEWRLVNQWLLCPNIRERDGVTVDDTGRVVGLNLSNSGLKGQLPPELGELTSLKELDLGSNDLSGEIPSKIGNLANLQFLSIWMTQLTGCVPARLEGHLHQEFFHLGCLPFCS